MAAIILIGIGILVVSKTSNRQENQTDNQKTNPSKTEKERSNPVITRLPSCVGNSLYTISPLPLNKIDFILPLGNLNPSGHSTPSDHIYFVITRKEGSNNQEIVDLFAPGDITIYTDGKQIKSTSGKIDVVDYFIDFASCKEVYGRFGHVSDLAGQLANLKFKDCSSYSGGTADLYEQCRANVNIKLKAVEKLGTAGRTAAFDFNTYDDRLPDPYVANRTRGYNLKAACPLDYYSVETKAKLVPLLGGGDKKRTAEPVCGDVFQDKAGTLQGNWYIGLADAGWAEMMSLVHDHIDPTVGVISIGGVVTDPGIWQFTPQHSGTVNREFSEVTVGDIIYCYQSSKKTGSRFLIQLFEETKLKIEVQSGQCKDGLKLNSPTTYQR